MSINIKHALEAESQWLGDFFMRAEVGLYIPPYQREYSWRSENVEQLMKDLCNGVCFLLEKEGDARDEELHYLGIIIVIEGEKLG